MPIVPLGKEVVVTVTGATTFTFAIPLAKFGALAVMVALPGATPVTGTVTVPLGETEIVEGTVATPELEDSKLTVTVADGAGDKVNVRF